MPGISNGYLQKALMGLLLLAVCGSVASLPADAGSFEIALKAYNNARYPLSIRYFRKALAANNQNPNIHYYLADALLKSSRYREAEQEYQKVLAMAPVSQAARFSRLGLTMIRQIEADNRHQSLSLLVGGSKNTSTTDKLTGMTAGDEDYLEEITDAGRYVRWSVLDFPIKLYVDESPVGVRNFQPTFASSMKRSMEIWSKALDNRMTFKTVSRPEDAHIRVTWVNSLDTNGQHTEAGTTYHAGITVPQIKNEQLYAMDLKMATFDIKGRPQDAEHIFTVAIHEMGHALGLLGHSHDKGDIMFPQNQMSFVLSKRDKNTIRKLYASSADITSRPPTGEVDESHQEELAKRLDEQIKKEEALVASHGSNLDYINLGTTYFQKGKEVLKTSKKLKDKDKKALLKSESQEWFDKAVKSIRTALTLEPNDALAYYNLSIIYQEFSDNTKALQAIERSLKIDSKTPKFFREKAWLLAKLGQKSAALNTLDAYLIRQPSATNSAEVKRIRQLVSKL